MRTWLVSIALATVLPRCALADEAENLVKAALDTLPKVSFVAKLTLVPGRGAARELELSHKLVKGARASLLKVTAPPELAGMRFLFLEHADEPSQQFFSLPASPKVIQVANEIRKHPFLGSDFYVADLVEPPLDAFTYTFVGTDEIAGRHCKLVESLPKRVENALYGSTIAAIDPIDRLVFKRLFTDGNGRLLKVWTVEKLEKVDGYWTLLGQKMRNVQEETESRLDIREIRYNVDLPDSLFAAEHLSRSK